MGWGTYRPRDAAGRRVVGRVVDKATDGKGFHWLGGVRCEQCKEGGGIFRRGIQPWAVGVRLENDGHPVVERVHEVIISTSCVGAML
jgi:hypothetical protein